MCLGQSKVYGQKIYRQKCADNDNGLESTLQAKQLQHKESHQAPDDDDQNEDQNEEEPNMLDISKNEEEPNILDISIENEHENENEDEDKNEDDDY